MDKDFLHATNLEIPCCVGTTREEKAFPQILTVTLKMEVPLAKAGKTDDLNDTVDYALIIKEITRALTARKFNLVEAVADTIAEQIFQNSKIHATEISVNKKVFAGIESVGVFIRRERSAST